jgi:eukaryotic-like serine/threonine-protein kinase
MTFNMIYADQLINRILDAFPKYFKKAKIFWDGLVDQFRGFLADNITSDYDILSNAEWILVGLIVIGLLILVGIYFIIKKITSKPKKIGGPVTPKEFIKAAKQEVKKGNLIKAGEYYEKAGKLKKAIDFYLKGRGFSRAANVYAFKLNNHQKALEVLNTNNMWDPAAHLLSQLGRHEEAADYYARANKQQMAADEYEKAGQLIKAADLYRQVRMFQNSANCYARAKAYIPAAGMFELIFNDYKKTISGREKPQDIDKLKDLAKKTAFNYKEGGEPLKAAEVLLQAKEEKLAAELFMMGGQAERAAELFFEDGELKRAAELFNKAGNKMKAAEIMANYHQSQGNELEAAKCLEITKDYLGAADVYAGLGQYEKAVSLYMKGGDSRTASEMLVASGQTEKAMQMFEQMGDMDSAIRLCEESGDNKVLAKLYYRQKKYFEAAMLFVEEEDPANAEKMFVKVTAEDPRYAEAQSKLGEIYLERGQSKEALEKFQAMASRIPFAPQTMDNYYLLARAYEENEEDQYALGLYQQLMAMNYHYKDAAMRVNSIASKLQSQGGNAFMATSPGGSFAQKGGKTIGERYQVKKELGRGGMGVVYLAEDLHLERNVALKVLAEEFKAHKQMVKSFITEARSLAKLSHPYIVSIYDAGEEGGIYYILMEYVEGKDFKELMKGDDPEKPKRLPVKAGIQVFSQLAQGLDYAHSLKIIHRDIKPANIMWANNIIKVMDFGLAKVMDKMREGRTAIAGTPYYMSPEQTLGRNVDHRSDIYSMGVTIYEMLTGGVPFKEGDIGYHHIHTPPPPPSQLNAQVTPQLENIILKCMAKDSNQRYQSAREVYGELVKLSG